MLVFLSFYILSVLTLVGSPHNKPTLPAFLSCLIQLAHFNLSSSVIPINSGIRFLNASHPHSSMIPLSLHLSFSPCLHTSAILCYKCILQFYLSSVLGFSVFCYGGGQLMYIKRAHWALFCQYILWEILPQGCLHAVLWITVILPWEILMKLISAAAAAYIWSQECKKLPFFTIILKKYCRPAVSLSNYRASGL